MAYLVVAQDFELWDWLFGGLEYDQLNFHSNATIVFTVVIVIIFVTALSQLVAGSIHFITCIICYYYIQLTTQNACECNNNWSFLVRPFERGKISFKNNSMVTIFYKSTWEVWFPVHRSLTANIDTRIHS